jgi:integrase/recombinase XerD
MTTLARQATTDDQLISLWLHGRSVHTQRAYSSDLAVFRAGCSVPLGLVTLGDLQAFADSLSSRAPATQTRMLSSIKSLLAFGSLLGYLAFNVGAAMKLPALRNGLSERILTEEEVHALIRSEPKPRNRLILRLLYIAGLRVDELAHARHADLQARTEAGQLTVFGKGNKTRVILLPAAMWRELASADSPGDSLIFPGRRGRPLHSTTIERIVLAAARRAGLSQQVSPHWLRHSHATHALERGAPIHLVAATLGHSSIQTTGRYLHARPTDSSARYLQGLLRTH